MDALPLHLEQGVHDAAVLGEVAAEHGGLHAQRLSGHADALGYSLGSLPSLIKHLIDILAPLLTGLSAGAAGAAGIPAVIGAAGRLFSGLLIILILQAVHDPLVLLVLLPDGHAVFHMALDQMLQASDQAAGGSHVGLIDLRHGGDEQVAHTVEIDVEIITLHLELHQHLPLLAVDFHREGLSRSQLRRNGLRIISVAHGEMALPVGGGGQIPHLVLTEQVVQRGNGVLLFHLKQAVPHQLHILVPVGDGLPLNFLSQIGVGVMGIGVVAVVLLRRVGEVVVHSQLTPHLIGGLLSGEGGLIKLDPEGSEGTCHVAQLSHAVVGIPLGIPEQLDAVEFAVGLAAQPHPLHLAPVGEGGLTGHGVGEIGGVITGNIRFQQVAGGNAIQEDLRRQEGGTPVLHRLADGPPGQGQTAVRGVDHPDSVLTQGGGRMDLQLIASLLYLRGTGGQQLISLIQLQLTGADAGQEHLSGDAGGAELGPVDPLRDSHLHQHLTQGEAVAGSPVGGSRMREDQIEQDLRVGIQPVGKYGEIQRSASSHRQLRQIGEQAHRVGLRIDINLIAVIPHIFHTGRQDDLVIGLRHIGIPDRRFRDQELHLNIPLPVHGDSVAVDAVLAEETLIKQELCDIETGQGQRYLQALPGSHFGSGRGIAAVPLQNDLLPAAHNAVMLAVHKGDGDLRIVGTQAGHKIQIPVKHGEIAFLSLHHIAVVSQRKGHVHMLLQIEVHRLA